MQKSIQRELVEFQSYLQSEGYSLAKASSAAFSKGRYKFSHGVFEGMIKLVVDFIYNECDDTQYWKGHTVLAVDGSTVEVPNDKKVVDEWGIHQTRSDGKNLCMARLSNIYDVVNNITIQADMDSMNTSEIEQFKTMFRGFVSPSNSLDVFDRLYASTLSIFELNHKGVDFCYRMKKDGWKVVETFYHSEAKSEIVTLNLPKKYWEEAAALGIKKKEVQVR